MGAVVDVSSTVNAVDFERADAKLRWPGWFLEVAQHLGREQRAHHRMDTTEGLTRQRGSGSPAAPITVPVGRKTLGRIMNVIGRPDRRTGPVNG